MAIVAGIPAWGIEIAVAGIMFYGLKREENKVYAAREKVKNEL